MAMVSPLAGMYAAQGGMGGAPGMGMMGMMDPALMGIQQQYGFGQRLMDEGSSTASAYPMQALARALQGVVGGYEMRSANDRMTQAMSGDGGDMEGLTAALGADHPLVKAMRSSNPLVRAYAFQALPKVLEQAGAPFDLGPGTQRFAPGGSTPVAQNTTPLTDVGKLIAARDALPAGDPRRAAFDAQIGKMSQEGGVTFGPDGAAAVPGYGPAAAGLAGQKAGAEAYAQMGPKIAEAAAGGSAAAATAAAYDPVTIQVPDGQGGYRTIQTTRREAARAMGLPTPGPGGGVPAPSGAAVAGPPAAAGGASASGAPPGGPTDGTPAQVAAMRPAWDATAGDRAAASAAAAAGGGPRDFPADQPPVTGAVSAPPGFYDKANPTLPAGPAGQIRGITVAAPENSAFKPLVEADTKEVATDREGAVKAQQDFATVREIQDFLPQVSTGWGAGKIQEGAMILQRLGVPQEQIQAWLKTDPSAGAILTKQFLTLSTGAVRGMGAREPGSVISMFNKAYPSIENTPETIKLQSNVILMNAQRQQDLANAKTDWLIDSVNQLRSGANYRGLRGFNEQFNKAHPPDAYMRAAEAMAGLPKYTPWAHVGDPAQQQAVIDLIPSGTTYLAPDGQLRVKR